MNLIPTPGQLRSAAGNVVAKALHGGVADLTPMPSTLLDEGQLRSVYRYDQADGTVESGLPVLLVPPLAAPALCFDLRRGASLVEHLVGAGRRTYLVDYGGVSFSDRRLGIEHWVDDVLPKTIATVSADSGGAPVQLVGWCLGGIFSLLTMADRPHLPVASVTAVASPVDTTAVPLIAPLRPIGNVTGGRIITAAYRALGGAPRPFVKRAFQLSAIDKVLTKPLAIARNLDDRDFLAQLEAVDRFTANMVAYPGRTFGQIYHRMFRANDLNEGFLDIAGRRIDLANVAVPVLVIAGLGDGIAPKAAVRRLVDLLPGSPHVRYEEAPGGHLGVLTGRAARGTTWIYLDEFLDATWNART